ncbi:peroxide stress protein YaaA [Floccifex sp.]|uniref:peroxide stress protein YaaA n=1 Tax=Floccifex sp. TaxID=2815810 RepID=UPI003F0BF549
MKIIISPAKQMKPVDLNIQTTKPMFNEQTQRLLEHLQSLDYDTLKKYMKCSDTIAQEVYDLYQNFDKQEPSCALLTYSGIQYQYMHAQVFNDDQFQYLQDHLYILSGLYGLVRPLDEIKRYRLEMQTKCPFSLYEYWSDLLANEIKDEIILNLASEEYAKCIRKYKKIIDVRFVEEQNGKYVEKGVYAKMARGAMVRFLAENKIEDIESIKNFKELGYTFDSSLSNENKYVFIRN